MTKLEQRIKTRQLEHIAGMGPILEQYGITEILNTARLYYIENREPESVKICNTLLNRAFALIPAFDVE